MKVSPPSLRRVIERLREPGAKVSPPPLTDPWQLILWENLAYLADEETRRVAWTELMRKVGTAPEQLLAASDQTLRRVTAHGILPAVSCAKLRACARILIDEFGGDLGPSVRLPLPAARRALRRFPSIGEPGADKILLFSRNHPVLALESNGLRVLVRLGFGEEQKDYARTYRSARAAAASQAPADLEGLIELHQLLRGHGQTLCRRTAPRCGECPIGGECPSFRLGVRTDEGLPATGEP